MPADEPTVLAGRVGRPHGLDGTFHVLNADAALLSEGREVTVAGRSARIDRRAGTDDRPLVRLEGFGGRDAAEGLGGEELRVPRSEVGPLEEDEWWAEDLVGCSVSDGDRAVGTVGRLLGLPSCEVLEVDRPDAGQLLIPLIRDAVRAVDVSRRRIDVDLRFLGEA